MRLFIAVNLDESAKRALLNLQETLRAQVKKGSFTRPENFHITLAFLGETPADRVPMVQAAIAGVAHPDGKAAHSSFTVSFNKTGCFSHSGKELWWLGAADSERLRALQDDVCAALDRAGLDFDRRAFNAHITLAREIKHSSPIELPPVSAAVPVNRISLMESRHIDGILTYTELFGYDLRTVNETSKNNAC
jgi:2'-5' RNA ligase